MFFIRAEFLHVIYFIVSCNLNKKIWDMKSESAAGIIFFTQVTSLLKSS